MEVIVYDIVNCLWITVLLKSQSYEELGLDFGMT